MDGFVHQLPDIDPTETAEWLDSLDAVVDTHGRCVPATCSPSSSSGPARSASAPRRRSPRPTSTPSRPSRRPWFPGDEYIERRIRAFIRWNAAVMVVKANKRADGIGGHLSTYASSAALYEVGFNHFFRGKDDGVAGDHVYFQGHAAPGIYARAFLEGRLDGGRPRPLPPRDRTAGLSSYPHPRLMPDFWEFPTVSMGLGPINSIYQARFNRYLHEPPHRRHVGRSHVWCFVGDGEFDEPETLGALSLAGRASGSTTSSSSSTATCSASTGRCAATARSSRSSRRCSAAPAGTSSRSSGARSGTTCSRRTSTACCSTR